MSSISGSSTSKPSHNTAVIADWGWNVFRTSGAKTHTGFENLAITGKWQAYTDPQHEFVVSLGIIREFGRTGTEHTGADAFGATAPTLYFGKGLGALVPRETQETVASLFPWVASICHGNAPSNPGDGSGKHPHPLPGWMVSPFCLSLSLTVPHPSLPVAVPVPVAVWIAWRPGPPPARAPPGRDEYAAQPRGPPTLI